MPDFNIKFKYEGSGKAAANVRNKAIAASKNAAKSPASNQTQRPVEQNRELVSSIKNLTSAVKSLERSMKAGGGGGNNRGGGGQPGFGGTAGGFGKVGAALGIPGAAIGLMGFAIQKINQIGTAYIDLVSRQAGTVGVSGNERTFRYKQDGRWRSYQGLSMSSGRRGMYLQTEQGAMIKAHRMAGGRFSGGISDEAIQLGSIFGMGAEEIGTISGRYARAGGNLGRAANVARGTGIETELPMFMQGMSSILEEAITNGVNASNLADDLGDQVAMITQRTGTQSVGMALNIVKNMRGVQQQVSRGQIGGYEQFATYRAAGSAINRRLANTQQRDEYLNSIISRGFVSQEEVNAARSRAQSAGRGLTLEDLEASGANIGSVLRRAYAARGGADVNEEAMAFHKRTFGQGAAGMRMWMSTLPGHDPNEQSAMWRGIGQRPQAGTEQRGAQAIQQRFNLLEKSAPMMGTQRQALREGLLMHHGAGFADTALEIEKSLISLASTFAPSGEAIKKVGEAATATAEALKGIKAWFDANFTPGAPQRNRSWLTASPSELGRRIRELWNGD